ncbi:hypothetical protein GGX14DRAFT_396745 [Mycena pura]|uniref:Uncharacterized protein n=1 Tax=Mycena pura TaxID=153505 RepID=A0AAD6VBW5_9AGAR|nr:hypothetical protein GGX14DRAFT_396745 [Mycena pura]
MSFLVLLLYLTAVSLGSPDVLGALASSQALFGRDDDPKAATEAAVRAVAGTLAGPAGRASSHVPDSPTSRCLDTCQSVGADKTIKSCEDKNPLFGILVTSCLCGSLINKLNDCAVCMQANASVVAAYQSFSSICFNYGFTSENGTALVGEPDFPHCEHAVYIWATPYFITGGFDLTFTPFNPANKSLPAEITDGGAGSQVSNYTFLVDYPVNTQITLNVTDSEAHSSAISTTLTVLNSSDTSWYWHDSSESATYSLGAHSRGDQRHHRRHLSTNGPMDAHDSNFDSGDRINTFISQSLANLRSWAYNHCDFELPGSGSRTGKNLSCMPASVKNATKPWFDQATVAVQDWDYEDTKLLFS